MTTTQKIILPVILAVMFTAAGMWARHDYVAHMNDEASQALRSCNVNPVNGATMEVR